MAKRSPEERYTDPGLREEIKAEIQASDKGGKPGQRSARKSQLLAREYEERGGGYKGVKDEDQKNLEKWTDEEWRTREGETKARRDDGETKRYLPKEAWERLFPEEREETEKKKKKKKKREGSKKGEQYVGNTEAAKEAHEEARGAKTPPVDSYDDLNVGETKGELEGLPESALKKARDYEKGHKDRKTLVGWLERRIGS